MNKLVLLAILLAGCSKAQQSLTRAAAAHSLASRVGPVSVPKSNKSKLPKGPLMIPIPKDPAQLKRLLAMGYKIHEDHLHAPGVTSCPKMSENPVQ
jgi:hypothetical protein